MPPISVCCLSTLPLVRRPDEAAAAQAPFTTAMAPLIDALQYPPASLDLLKTRYCALVDSADRETMRSEWWDTRLFMLGFGGSLLVTIAAAIGQSGYMTLDSVAIVNTIVLLLSSVATAALGLRERLKFREQADVWKRLSSVLQRRGFLFLSRSGKYSDLPPDLCFQAFMLDVENLKLQSDREHQALKAQDETHPTPRAPDPVPVGSAVATQMPTQTGDLLGKEDAPVQDMMAVQGGSSFLKLSEARTPRFKSKLSRL